ncbi:MAG: hypothetical protein R3F50_18890 [Gammaproteobacteria bacterium]
MNKYFNQIGAYAWIRFVVGNMAKSVSFRKYPPDSHESLAGIFSALYEIYKLLTTTTQWRLTREFRHGLGITASVDTELGMALLIRHFQELNGFSFKWFHAYYARAVLLEGVIEEEQSYRGGLKLFITGMQSAFLDHPLGKPLPVEEYPWSDVWIHPLEEA